MNLPIRPGQNNKGKNGASVVSVPASTGIKISPAATFAAMTEVDFSFTLSKDPMRIFDHDNSVIYDDPQVQKAKQRVR